MRRSLNGVWKLYCLKETGGKNPPFGVMPGLSNAFLTLSANVPGEVQLDLEQNGVEPDPFYSDNYYSYIKYENCGWVYRKSFDFSAADLTDGSELVLRFDGIDAVADVFLNGVLLGHTENMLVEHEFVADGVIKDGENELTVHIFSTFDFIRQKDYPVGVHGSGDRMQLPYVRKAPHSFGWDIFPRMLTAGLWRDVYLFTRKKTRITETYFAVSSVNENGARLRWAVRFDTDRDELDGFEIKISANCKEHSFGFSVRPGFTAVNSSYFIDSPRLWWPKGCGEPDLYSVTTSLCLNGSPVDSKTEKIGLRSVRLIRDFTPGSQRFEFIVNNEPLFLRGSNHVPADVMHSRAKGKIESTVRLLNETGCNIIRSWGGGIYEDDELYERCDESGIFVWQDFAFGNAAYPQDGSLDENITDEITKLVKRIRNHPCLLIYSSDNEIDMRYRNMDYPQARQSYNKISQELLPNVTSQHDPYRYYMASSPETPFGYTVDSVPEQHTWGARAWFKDDYYKHSSACFIGEAGYHGCPSPESLRKFIPEKNIWPVFNRSYAAHSTEDLRYSEGLGRIRMMADQVEILCGERTGNIEDFSFVSQFAQGEAIKFFIERSLFLRPKRTGIIWWNIVDGWPQISDAIVDYYHNKKLGFDFIRRSQYPVTAFVGELSGWDHPFVIANCTLADAEVSYIITDGDTGETLLEGQKLVPANKNVSAGGLRIPLSAKRLLLINYTVNGKKQLNHYITGTPPYDLKTLRRWLGIINANDDR